MASRRPHSSSQTKSGILPIDSPQLSWLAVPSQTRVTEPVDTLLPTLPLGELAWEDFERLCLRLVRREEDVEYCQLYGTRGQDQAGIDLYARKSTSSKYTVFQCKKVRQLGPALIEKTVDEFIEDGWADKTDTFVLCTSENLTSADRADKVREQSELLGKKGIAFTPWDLGAISEKLKAHPDLVHDFFGTGWVRVFCGEQAILGLTYRLQPHQVTTLRTRLADCYRRVFDTHDPGLPGDTLSGMVPLAFKARFVLPDIQEGGILTLGSSEAVVLGEPQETNADLRVQDIGSAGDVNVLRGDHQAMSQAKRRHVPHTRARQAVSGWLNGSRCHVVLGLPGSGKSSLLRFVALDLLDDNPSLGAYAQQWGQYLPMWVPFALWTKLIKDTPGVPPPLKELLRRWFAMLGEETLWPLVEEALADGRLLLLVDGLDEWTSEPAARVALDLCKMFVEQHDIPAIATSRPQGFRQLGAQTLGWHVGEISGLSQEQQRNLATFWFSGRLKHLGKESTGSSEADVAARGREQAEEFLAALEQSSDLKDLAEVPLLLLLLIVLKMSNVDLPRSRFEAYDRLIKHLSKVHPRGRLKAASVASEEPIPLSDSDFEASVARLAYVLHTEHGEGQITTVDAATVLTNYLKDDNVGLGYGHKEAREMAARLVDSFENAVGLLVRRSETEVAFFHRSFEEYLTALHLSSWPREERIAFVAAHCADAAWREPLLGLFYLTRVPAEVGACLEATEGLSLLPSERHAADLLLYETAFGDYKCPVPIVRRITDAAFRCVDYEHWMPHRARVLRLALGGLRSARTRDMVREKVRRWFPLRDNWRAGIYDGIGRWATSDETIECLWQGMHDENVVNQRAAGEALMAHAGSEPTVINRVKSLAVAPADPKTRAAAIRSLANAEVSDPQMDEIITWARYSASSEMRLAAIMCKIKMGTQTEQDRRAVLRLAGVLSDIDYHWKEDVVEALITGWPESPRTLTACLRAVTEHGPTRKIDHQQALMVLVSGYPQHPLVAQLIADELRNSGYGLHGSDEQELWRQVLRNFKDNPVVVAAIDEWLPRDKGFGSVTAWAALVGRTEVAKHYLLSRVERSLLHYTVPALLEGWGMADDAVSEAVSRIAWGAADRASYIGRQLALIIPNPQACRERIQTILMDPACDRYDIMLSAMAEAGTDQDKEEAVGVVLPRLSQREGNSEQSIGSFGLDDPAYLFSDYATDERVKEAVRATLEMPDCNWSAVARFFADDTQMRSAVMRACNALPAALRQIIAEFLSDGHSDDADFALSLLRQYNLETDADVKVQASIGYHQLLVRRHDDLGTAVKLLAEDIVSYGTDMSALRQAAFAGLMILGRYDVVLGAREIMRTPGDDEERFADLRLGTLNDGLATPLGQYMVAHWHDLTTAMGTRLLPFLSGSSYSHYKFEGERVWSALCLFADTEEASRQAVLQGLEAASPRFSDENVLLFLSRVRPSSPLLLDYCMAALHEARGRNYIFVPEAISALEIIGRQFVGESQALSRLTMPLVSHSTLAEVEAVALCETGMADDQLWEIWGQLGRGRHRHWLFFNTRFQFACRLAHADEIMRLLDAYLFRAERRHRTIQPIARPLITRLGRDGDLAGRLWERLSGGQATASAKASFPKLLAAAEGLTTDLRDWCAAELKAQSDPSAITDVGIDLVKRQVQPIAWSLLDLLS